MNPWMLTFRAGRAILDCCGLRAGVGLEPEALKFILHLPTNPRGPSCCPRELPFDVGNGRLRAAPATTQKINHEVECGRINFALVLPQITYTLGRDQTIKLSPHKPIL